LIQQQHIHATLIRTSRIDQAANRTYIRPEDIMKKSSLLFISLALLFTVTLPLHAQTGCTDSPENPTAILAVVGSAAAFFVSARARIKSRRK
jgi:XrtJ-associated TM-motif-TM protein